MTDEVRRVPVNMTDAEYQEIYTAMTRAGYRAVSDFLRVAALAAARKEAQ